MQSASAAGLKPRRGLAFLMWALAALLVLLALNTLVWDIVSPDEGGGSPTAQQGARVGSYLGMAFRTFLLGGVAYLCYRKGLAFANPAVHGRKAIVRELLNQVVTATHEHAFQESNPQKGRYQQCEDEELLNIYDNIRAEDAPDSFDEVVREIHSRIRPATMSPE